MDSFDLRCERVTFNLVTPSITAEDTQSDLMLVLVVFGFSSGILSDVRLETHTCSICEVFKLILSQALVSVCQKGFYPRKYFPA